MALNNNPIIDILVQRDDMTEQEALSLINETAEEIQLALESGEFYDIENIMMCNLGLEMDYIYYLL